MAEPTLSGQERLALLALLTLARPVTNSELKQEAGLELSGERRRRLNDQKLVESRRRGRAFVHNLTDAGAVRCEQELSSDRPDRVGSYGGVLWATLGAVHRHLGRHELALSDVFRPDVEALVRQRYDELADAPGAPVRMSALREAVDDAVPARELDAELVRMAGLPDVHLRPVVDQKTLTDEDRAAAVTLGGEDRHNIQIKT